MRAAIVLTTSVLISTPVLVATAQHPEPKHHAQPLPAQSAKAPGPHSVLAYGAFQRMVETQDYAPKVQLGTVMQAGATEGVGAVSGLRGEITIVGGQLLVSYGVPCATCGEPGNEHAALLATAKVAGWQAPLELPSDLTGHALDDFIIARAKIAGMDITRPFPVRITGILADVKMHVLRGPNPQFKGHGARSKGHASSSNPGHVPGHGGGHRMADQEEIVAARIDGEVVGFYAPPSWQGLITHPGEPFHFHWNDLARTRTAHLDKFVMTKGAKLLLPKP